ncbi:MAG: DUF2264 domain-containing protein [Mycetocola sp.]
MNVSPHTAPGWSREQWTAAADRLLAAAREWVSPSGARITPPGAEGGYGHDVDGLEGFARTLLLVGFRLAGEPVNAPHAPELDDLAEFYRRGIAAGVDPSNPDRWVRMDEHAQAKVEAASIAVALDMTRSWIWDRLDAATRQRVIDYLAPVVGDTTYPQTNWLWFRVVVETFLRSVGGPWSATDISDDLALHDELTRADGWISDGYERSYDHYVGWALHVYPVLWSRMQGAGDLGEGRITADVAALDRYLQDAVHLVGADGAPLMQGRSLIYRFAAAAPFWIGVVAEVPSQSPGRLRSIAERIVHHFERHNAPDQNDQLTLGWHHEWTPLAQSYSGPGSPYWAVKGFLGLMLPADHPVWTADAEKLPVELGDRIRVVRPAGWVISTTADDGIARIANHGTDHALAGALSGDSPLYARIGYSTAAAPLADAAAWEQPIEQSVALVDRAGRATHRTAMTLCDVHIDGETAEDSAVGTGNGTSVGTGPVTGVAASTWDAHWITPDPSAHRHGSGLEGTVKIAGTLTVVSILRRAWELRLSRVDALAEPGTPLRLRIGGWALAGPGDAVTGSASGSRAILTAGELSSVIEAVPVNGTISHADAVIVRRHDASMLGPDAAVPTLELVANADAGWTATLITLSGTGTPPPPASAVTVQISGTVAAVTWPDGLTSTSTLQTPEPAPADRSHPQP